MSRKKIYSVLLWKEARVIMPLAAAVAGIALVLYAITLLWPSEGNMGAAFFSYMVLFPNLVALGTPSLQIGHEEETGTLAWQRSVPVSWWAALLSKFIVAVGACALVWLVCIGGMGLALATGRIEPALPIGGLDAASELLRYGSFSLLLLCCSFATSWLLRSPAAALFVVVPLIGGLTVAAIQLARWTETVWMSTDRAGINETGPVAQGLAQLGLAVVAALAAAVAARWRWGRPGSFEANWLSSSAAHPAYFPARAVPQARPGLRRALLWQTVRQSRANYFFAACLLLFAWWAEWVSGSNPANTPWFFLGGILCTGLLGLTTFVGDTTRGRSRFLAEHGVARWTLWWTRMAVPLAVAALVSALFLALESDHHRRPGARTALFAILSAAFAMGSLSSIWARRPLVIYFAAPVLLSVAMMTGGFVYAFYPEYTWTSLVAVALLIGTTYRMSYRWSEGDTSPGYHGRMLGWLGIAAIGLTSPIAAERWWTTPPRMPEWRQQTYAAANELDGESTDDPLTHLALPSVRPYIRNIPLSGEEFASLRRAIERVRTGELTDVYIDASPMDALLQRAHSPGDYSAVGGQAAWFNGLLTLTLQSIHAPARSESLYYADMGDELETMAARHLSDPATQELIGEERWRELVSQLRAPEQRRQVRRRALLLSWAESNSRDAEYSWQIGRYGGPFGPRQILAAERWRAWRQIDWATRISLDQLAEGLPAADSPAERARMDAWAAAVDGRPTRYWNREFDEAIEQVRRQVPEETRSKL